jgi:predicted enzyme related to lactoylglutathione lyase
MARPCGARKTTVRGNMQYGTNKGEVAWIDLTVPAAGDVAGFYEAVVGWNRKGHDMGEYEDYEMQAGENTTVGICHARGTNAAIPSQWLVYVNVESVSQSAARCTELGGEVLDGPRTMGKSWFCVVRDPSGAVLGLLSEGE